MYDGAGRTIASTNPENETTTTIYDEAGRAVVTVDALGRRTTSTYDEAGRSIAVTNPENETTTTVYDDAGRTIATLDPLDHRSSTVYDDAGQSVVTIDPLGHRTTTAYDAAGRAISQTNAENEITTTVYDEAGRSIAQTNPENETTTTVYDDAGQSIATVDPLGNITTRGYDMAGRTVTQTNPENETTTTVYDEGSRSVATVNPLGYRTTTVHDGAGRVVATEDANNHRTSTTYDDAGQTIASIDPLGNVTSTVYDAAGRSIAMVNALGDRTTTVYDAVGQTIATVNSLNERTSNTYDGAGRQTRVENPLGEITTTAYDDAGRSIVSINPLNYRTTTVYDAAGRAVSVTDANGNVSSTVYDAVGRTIANVTALGHRTTTVYDEAGRRQAIVDARANRTTFSYDGAGREIRQTNPLNLITTSGYDAAGRKTKRLDARGALTSYVFDAAGQEIKRHYSDGSRVTTTFDPVGKRLAVADSTGTYTRTYDEGNLTTSTTYPSGQRLTFTYDALRRREAMANAAGGWSTSTYDAAGRLIVLSNPAGGLTTYSYDAAGRRTSLRLANGTRTSMVYNAAAWLADVDHLKSDNTVIQTFDYTYDHVGNRESRLDADGNRVTWTYDATYQLTEEHRTGTNAFRTTYTYDATGNRLTEDADGAVTTSTYNAANQLLVTLDSIGDRTTYTYDNAGNQQTKEEPSGDLTTNTWNAENELTQVELPSGAVVTYTYNSDLLRVGREEDIDNVGYIWDKKNLLHETDEFGDPLLDYHYEQQEYGNLLSRHEDTETVYYHFDALGSTDALTDSTEVVTDEYTYNVWGKELVSTGTTDNPFRWVGQKGYQYDGATGNHTLRRREYDSGNGRFKSEDPLGFEAGDANLFRYVKNNVPNEVDPSGLTNLPLPDRFLGQYTIEKTSTRWHDARKYMTSDIPNIDIPKDKQTDLRIGYKVEQELWEGCAWRAWNEASHEVYDWKITALYDGIFVPWARKVGLSAASKVVVELPTKGGGKKSVVDEYGAVKRAMKYDWPYDAGFGGTINHINRWFARRSGVLDQLHIVPDPPEKKPESFWDRVLKESATKACSVVELIPDLKGFCTNLTKCLSGGAEIKNAAGDIVESIFLGGPKAIDSLKSGFHIFVDRLQNQGVGGIFEAAVNKLIDFQDLEGLKSLSGLSKVFTAIVKGEWKSALKSGLESLGLTVENMTRWGLEWAKTNISGLSGAEKIIGTIVDGVEAVKSGTFSGWISGIVGQQMQKLQETIDSLTTKVKDIVDELWDKTVISELQSLIFKNLLTWISKILGGPILAIAGAVNALLGVCRDFVEGGVLRKVADLFKQAQEGISGGTIATALIGLAVAKETVKPLVRFIGKMAGFANLPKLLADTVKKLVTAVKAAFLKLLDILYQWIKKLFRVKDDGTIDTCSINPQGTSSSSCFGKGIKVLDKQKGLTDIDSYEQKPIEDRNAETYTDEERAVWNLPEGESEPTGERCLVRLVLEHSEDNKTYVWLKRPLAWLGETQAHVGGTVWLDLPEQGARGHAKVVEVQHLPPRVPKPGQPVTGFFHHTKGIVYELKLDSESKPLVVTATHPFKSEDRKAFVAAGDLRIGETLKTLTGTARVESIAKRPDPEPVYNIEVEGDHVYRVGESGVLVHNASVPKSCSKLDPCNADEQNDFLKKSVTSICPMRPFNASTVAVALFMNEDGSLDCVFSISWSLAIFENATTEEAIEAAAQRLRQSFQRAIGRGRLRSIRHVFASLNDEYSQHAETQIIDQKGANQKLCAIAVSRPVCAKDVQHPRQPSTANTSCSQRLGRISQTTCLGIRLADRIFDEGIPCPPAEPRS